MAVLKLAWRKCPLFHELCLGTEGFRGPEKAARGNLGCHWTSSGPQWRWSCTIIGEGATTKVAYHQPASSSNQLNVRAVKALLCLLWCERRLSSQIRDRHRQLHRTERKETWRKYP